MQAVIPKEPTSIDIPRDKHGYLLDPQDWTEELAHELALDDEVVLDAEQEEIVHFVRDYYNEKATVPEARTLLKHLKQVWDTERATRKYVYHLFPRGYAQQACKYAGMRIPLKLMLDL